MNNSKVDYDEFISKMLGLQPKQAFLHINDFCNLEVPMLVSDVLYAFKHARFYRIRMFIPSILGLRNFSKTHNRISDDDKNFIKTWKKFGLFIDKPIEYIFDSKDRGQDKDERPKSVSWSKFPCKIILNDVIFAPKSITIIIQKKHKSILFDKTLGVIDIDQSLNNPIKFFNIGC
jgi:hypothetical protein